MILDPESDSEQVMTFIKELLEKMDSFQEKAYTYKNHQKTFKVCGECVKRTRNYPFQAISMLLA